MKTLSLNPFLAVEPADKGWFVICSPGPLAMLLAELSGEKVRECTIFISPHIYPSVSALPGPEPSPSQRAVVAIPLTPALDAALVHLVDALISMRYETGQVQFTLKLGLEKTL